MTHGKKAKKSAKALDKPRTAKIQPKAAKKTAAKNSGKAGGSKASPAGKRAEKGRPAAAVKQAEGDGNGKARRKRADEPSFSNPAVASAFRRAIKKFSTALRRLAD